MMTETKTAQAEAGATIVRKLVLDFGQVASDDVRRVVENINTELGDKNLPLLVKEKDGKYSFAGGKDESQQMAAISTIFGWSAVAGIFQKGSTRVNDAHIHYKMVQEFTPDFTSG